MIRRIWAVFHMYGTLIALGLAMRPVDNEQDKQP